MLNDGHGDLLTLLFATLIGVGLCLFYDILRVFRKTKKHSNIAIFFEDILFCVIAALATFILELVRTQGEMRVFIFFGELIGFVICRFTISRITFKVFKQMFILIKKLIKFVKFKILKPIKYFVDKIFDSICKFFKKQLKTTQVMLYNVGKKRQQNKAQSKLKKQKKEQLKVQAKAEAEKKRQLKLQTAKKRQQLLQAEKKNKPVNQIVNKNSGSPSKKKIKKVIKSGKKKS